MLSRTLHRLSGRVPVRAAAGVAAQPSRRFHAVSPSGDGDMKDSGRRRGHIDPVNRAEESKSKEEAASASRAFPYSNVSEQQFKLWSEEIRQTELPLQAFFAGHRPLLLMDTAKGKRKESAPYLRVWSPRTNLFDVSNSTDTFGDNGSEFVMKKIADKLGPFNSDEAVKNLQSVPETWSSSFTTQPEAENKVVACTVVNLKDGSKQSPETTTIILARTETDQAALKAIVSFLEDGMPDSISSIDMTSADPLTLGSLYSGPEMSATSVKRKRKLKMNRHKYKKRKKAQRSLRKRLGK